MAAAASDDTWKWWEWGRVGVGNTLHRSLRYLDLSGHGPDVNNSFVDIWTLEFIALLG